MHNDTTTIRCLRELLKGCHYSLRELEWLGPVVEVPYLWFVDNRIPVTGRQMVDTDTYIINLVELEELLHVLAKDNL